MTTAERINTIAENQPLIFAAGQKKEYDAFWDAYQQNGERTSYERAFAGIGWNDETFKPKYKVRIVGSAYMTFAGCNISKISPELVDASGATSFNYAFYYQNTIKEIDIDCSSAESFNDSFYGGTLTDITLRNIKNTCKFSTAFRNVTLASVINLTITGEVGTDVDLSTMTGLSHASLISVLSCLYDYSSAGGTHTLTLGSTNEAKLSEEEKQIATQKGWTIG